MMSKGEIMKNEDAIAVVEKAIIWCDLRDLPKTKASMADLLKTLHSAKTKRPYTDLKPTLLH
jgi:hypothetical protein